MNIFAIMRSVKKSRAFKGIRPYLNLLYYDPGNIIIRQDTFDTVSVDRFSFHMSDQIDSLQRVIHNPWFEGVRETDIVLDIGANIGAITIPLAKVAKKTYAVEPLFIRELSDNIYLNHLHRKVSIIPYAIGEQTKPQEVEFSSKKAIVKFKTFAQLLKDINKQVDFIKIDGEGCEWDIKPEQLEGIREIRLEFHLRRSHKLDDKVKLAKYMRWFQDNNYEVHKEWGKTPLCVPFTACLVLRATKKETS